MVANANTAIAESGITYIRRFIGSPPTYTSNSFTDGNKSQKVRKQSATYLLSSEGKTSQHGAHYIEKGQSPEGPRPSPRRYAVDSSQQSTSMSSYPVHRPIPPTQRYSSNIILLPCCPYLKTIRP